MPLDFKPESIGRGGRTWSVNVTTVQDLQADPNGDVIYAEGTCYVFSQQGVTGPRVVTNQTHLDNRCIEILNGKPAFIRGRTIYKRADSKNCLCDILNKLIVVGSSS